MFWGPYKDEWKDRKGNADNRDCAIAKRLGLTTAIVSGYTDRICKLHFDRVEYTHDLLKKIRKHEE